MGLILKFLSGPLGIYALIAVVCLVGGSLSYAYVAHLEASNATIKRDAAVNESKQLLVALQSKDVVIQSLELAADLWRENAVKSAAAQVTAGNAAARYRSELAQAQSRISALSEKDRDLPDCQTLLDTDLAAVCPGTAASLREWAKRGLQRSSDNATGAGGAAAGSAAH